MDLMNLDENMIDSFLSEKELKELKKNIFTENFPYSFVSNVNYNSDSEDYNSYFAHIAYANNLPMSNFAMPIMDIFIPKFVKLNIFTSLIRIKVNCYPHTDTIREHPAHKDCDMPIRGALFSLNTCDGYTKFVESGKVFDSVDNRIVFFDSSRPHISTTTTNKKARFNINFNFL
tara:strand:+ start:348 stop:869 length:522 start_codon:yes stop_codon:yes gene_type:complete